MLLGVARTVINWPIGLPMAGYSARTSLSTGVHQSLNVRALVAGTNDGRHSICMLSVETVCVDAEFTALLRAALEQKHGFAPDSVMVAATHTHAAPAGVARFEALGGSETFLGKYTPQRVTFLAESCMEAVENAIAYQIPVRLSAGIGRAENVGKNRRDPSGPNDTEVAFLRAVDLSDRPVTLVYSFPCHPTILDAHNTLYSGDLAGVTCSRLEGELGCTVLALTGAGGDLSTRFTRQASTVGELDQLANLLADGLNVPTDADDHDSVASACVSVNLPLKPPPDRDQLTQALADAQRRLAHHPPAERRLIEAEIEGLQVALEAGPRPTELATEVQVLRLGQTLITGLPGELFVEYGLALRERLAPFHVLVAGYTNDYVGYIPTAEATRGYEVESALVTEDAGRLLLAAIQKATQQCLTATP